MPHNMMMMMMMVVVVVFSRKPSERGS